MGIIYACAIGFALTSVVLAVCLWRISKANAFPYKEVRIVTLDHQLHTFAEGAWKPVSHMKVLYDDITSLREHDDGTHSYSFEYR